MPALTNAAGLGALLSHARAAASRGLLDGGIPARPTPVRGPVVDEHGPAIGTLRLLERLEVVGVIQQMPQR